VELSKKSPLKLKLQKTASPRVPVPPQTRLILIPDSWVSGVGVGPAWASGVDREDGVGARVGSGIGMAEGVGCGDGVGLLGIVGSGVVAARGVAG